MKRDPPTGLGQAKGLLSGLAAWIADHAFSCLAAGLRHTMLAPPDSMHALTGDLIARFYIWHGTFLVDVLSVAPWIAEVSSSGCMHLYMHPYELHDEVTHR